MKTIPLGTSGLTVPRIAVGMMRIHEVPRAQAEELVKTALEEGANFFDHADIYGGGTCEEIFADVLPMNDDMREKVILQSKCGIRMGVAFDFSKKHILEAVDGILKRLKTDYLDVLLLHRPDILVEPEEVAAAFDELESSGKVRHFGVSNQTPMYIKLLKTAVKQPLVANQLQLSLTHASMLTQITHMNMAEDAAIDRDGSVVDYCRLENITIQPWSPFQYGFFEGVFIGSPKFPALNTVLDKLAAKYNVSATTIALAWVLRHPANMQPIAGTMNPGRLKECVRATEITLSREEWYELYLAAGHTLP